MNNPERGKIIWLIKKNKINLDVIGYMRGMEESLGYVVIGGPTGTHCSGHGESGIVKWNKLLSQGYIKEIEAKIKNIIPKDWKSPKLKQEEKELIEIFRRKPGKKK